MTLKEQIIPHVQYWDCYNDEPLEYDHTNKVGKIADNYAIGFAEWLRETFESQKCEYLIGKSEKELLTQCISLAFSKTFL